jgi:hypothetical protein
MSRIIVHIDRLVLHGFRHADRHAIADGLRTELGQYFAGPDAARLLTSRGDLPHLKPGDFRVGLRATPARIGSQAGRAIGKGLKS